MGAFVIFLIIVGALFLIAIGMYNSLVTLRNRCDNAWSQVDGTTARTNLQSMSL